MSCSECFVSVVAPLYNDSDVIEPFVAEVMDVLRKNYTNYELVLVNDGSTDDTARKVVGLLSRYECIRLLNLSKSFGTEGAIASGLDSVIGDFTVILDPGEDPPSLIPGLVQRAQTGCDIIQGVRKSRAGQPRWLRAGARLFYWCCRRVLKIPIEEDITQLKVLSRRVVNAITRVDDMYRYFRLLGSYVGHKNETYLYEPVRRRTKGKKKTVGEAVRLAVDIMVANSLRPLRWACYLGIIASLINLLYIAFVIAVYLLKTSVAPGWSTLSLQIALMFFLISVILSIMCEYVGMLFERSKGWMAYYVSSEDNSSVLIANANRSNVVSVSERSPEGQEPARITDSYNGTRGRGS